MKRTFKLFSLAIILALVSSLLKNSPIPAHSESSIDPVALALPSGWSNGILYGIWGSTAENVYAAGAALDATRRSVPLLYHNNGTGWIEASPSFPSGQYGGRLYGGWTSTLGEGYVVGEANFLPLLYHDNGTGWTEAAISLPAGWSDGLLINVWGFNANNVYAVGRGSGLAGNAQPLPLLYHSNGLSWTADSPLLPDGWRNGFLHGVWGSSANDVYVVGTGTDAIGTELPLVYHDTGTGWVKSDLALPAGLEGGILYGVFGFSATDIYTAGYGYDSFGKGRPLVYHYDGSSWSENSPAAPPGSGWTVLNGLWGSPSGDLYSAGFTYDSFGDSKPLLYQKGTNGWTQVDLWFPPDGSVGYLHTIWGSNAGDVYAGGEIIDGFGNLLPLLYQSTSTPSIHYVKWNAAGANNGTSWADAYTDLQSALSAASSGDEIWVAAGTYKPTSGTDRTISFTLRNGIAIYGGFAGMETLFSQRNIETNVTILSGDIGVSGNNSDNSYHVVIGSNTNNSAVLDGFTITRGNASNALPIDDSHTFRGGGLYNYLGSPSISNIIFSENYAVLGGGMNNDGVFAMPPTPAGEGSNPALTNVSFINNSAIEGGGLRNEDNSSPTLTSVVFDGNRAQRSGGGMANLAYNNTVLTNVTFKNNIVSSEINDGGGGGMANFLSVPVLTNVTFNNNSAPWGGGMLNAGSNSKLTNVTFSNNISTRSGGGIDNYQSSPILTNVTFSGNSALTSGGGIYNESNSSLTVRNTILWGNTAPVGSQIYNDASVSTISDSVVQGGFPDGTNTITNDPVMGVLGNYGGLTETIPLESGSSAINTGNDTNCPSTDQRGVNRPQGSHCDIGAYEVETETTPPTVTSIVRASANPTSAPTVNFQVMLSEPVTGVGTDDFALHTTGTVAGSSIQSVNGSDTLYTVTVNVAAGYGSLRLDVPVTATINDLSGNTLGNLPFITGEAYTIARNNGADTAGVFRPSNGLLYLKNKNDTGFADIALNYGLPGDDPVVGDWDGNGTVTIGIYRGNTFYLRNENTIGFATIVFDFGQVGDQPIAGDWNGDGVDTIGIFRPSHGNFLLRDSNTAGPAEMDFFLGNPGDVGIAGDWNGDGLDTTGVFRPSNGIIFLKNANETGFADIALNYGIPGDKPVIGDWDNDGIDTIGVYRNGLFMLRNSNTIGFAEVIFGLGNPGDIPIAGNWDGLP